MCVCVCVYIYIYIYIYIYTHTHTHSNNKNYCKQAAPPNNKLRTITCFKKNAKSAPCQSGRANLKRKSTL